MNEIKLNPYQILYKLNKQGEWQRALILTKKFLKKTPLDHRLRERLVSTYYELRQYKRALRIGLVELKRNPTCPLLFWDVACALDMLDREPEAILMWKTLMRRSQKQMAMDECSEGPKWPAYLINDCRYRIGVSYLRIGKKKLAKRYLLAHLKERRFGLPSDYPRKRAESKLREALSSKT